MKCRKLVCYLLAFILIFSSFPVFAENENATSIRDLVISEKKPFSFRNGVSWAMTLQQVQAIENIPMKQVPSSDWSVLISESPVQVSRFQADLVYIFYQDALRMITYEFQQNDSTSLNFQYLTGALCSVYGENKDANPIVIKSWMDRIYKDYYQLDKIHDAKEWTAEDGTSIFLYYFKNETFAILYVCPVTGNGNNGYDTNGL
jgi:hypothetical protein